MALANTIDRTVAARNLATWLGEGVEVTDLDIPSASGLSTQTVLFTAAWPNGDRRRLVARVAPDGAGVFSSYDLEKEALVMGALAEHTDVPAPRIVHSETDPAVLGAPFLVMEHVEGTIPSDDPPFTTGGWVLDMTADQRADMWADSIDVLARIHAVDWRAQGLEVLDQPQHAPGVAAQLDRWVAYDGWAREGEPNPTLDAAWRWLREHRPPDGEKVLTWGDARVGNIIYSAAREPVAVLDWEMVALADREMELGWWLFLQRHHTEGIGAPLPEGIPDAAATVARYEQVSGVTLRDLHWYEVFAGTRLASIMVRAAHMMIAGGMLPPDSTMALNNPASQLVARLLELPSPTGDTVSFIGNR